MGIALAEVILDLHGSFTLEWRLVIYVPETFVKVRITKRSGKRKLASQLSGCGFLGIE